MTTGHPLSRLFERNTRAFSRFLPAALDGEVEPLHQCRVATRRLREILPLVAAEALPERARRARRRLRRVGRALGPVRELDVSLELLDGLSQPELAQEGAREAVARYLEIERAQRREQMLVGVRSVNTQKLERSFAEIARWLGMREETDAWAHTLVRQMGRRAERLREAITLAGPLYIADRVHAVRIAAKKLRYALEIADATQQVRLKRVVRQIKQVQDVLGRLHDFDVLAARVQELAASPGDQSLQDDLESLRLRLEHECRTLHGRYLARQSVLLEACDVAELAGERITAERGAGAVSRLPAGRVLKMRLSEGPRRSNDRATRGS